MGREVFKAVIALLILLACLTIAQVLHRKTGLVLTADGIHNFLRYTYDGFILCLPKAAGASLIFLGYRILCLGFIKEEPTKKNINLKLESSPFIFTSDIDS